MLPLTLKGLFIFRLAIYLPPCTACLPHCTGALLGPDAPVLLKVWHGGVMTEGMARAGRVPSGPNAEPRTSTVGPGELGLAELCQGLAGDRVGGCVSLHSGHRSREGSPGTRQPLLVLTRDCASRRETASRRPHSEQRQRWAGTTRWSASPAWGSLCLRAGLPVWHRPQRSSPRN